VSDEQAFIQDILTGQPEPPLYFARMKVLNRDGVPVLGKLPQPAVAQDASALRQLCDPAQVTVVDTRPWDEFKQGHVAGAIHAVPGKMFPMVVGSFVQPDRSVALVCEPQGAEELVRDLVRIGYDRVVAVIPPAAVRSLPALERESDESVQDLARDAARGDAFILDVRNASEHAAGAVEGSRNVAYTRLATALSAIPRDRRVLVHCARGGRSAAAVSYLRAQGFDAVNIAGGFDAWRAAGLSVHAPANHGQPA
jgi:hydroxyacylglutathione hydrolase